MEDENKSFKYTILCKEDIDKALEKIISECKKDDTHETITKIIREAFYNRLILTQNCKGWDSINVYRITKVYPGFDPLLSESFSYPPNPKRGRANLEGFPVFYCSVNPKTALLEMKEVLTSGETYYVSEWKIDFLEDVLIQPLIYNSTTLEGSFEMSDIVKDQMEKVFSGGFFGSLPDEQKENIKHLFLRLGDLFTLPGSENYHITSSYAHSLLYDMKKQPVLPLSILMYPSVTSEHKGINLAIHPDFVNSKMMSLNSVSKVKVLEIKEEGVHVTVIEAGIRNDENTIDWFHPATTKFEWVFDHLELYTDNGLIIEGQHALNLKINNSSDTIKDILYECLDSIAEKLPTPDFGVGFNLFPIKRTQKEVKLTQTFRKGNVVETPEGLSNIEKITVDLRYIETLKPNVV